MDDSHLILPWLEMNRYIHVITWFDFKLFRGDFSFKKKRKRSENEKFKYFDFIVNSICTAYLSIWRSFIRLVHIRELLIIMLNNLRLYNLILYNKQRDISSLWSKYYFQKSDKRCQSGLKACFINIFFDFLNMSTKNMEQATEDC